MKLNKLAGLCLIMFGIVNVLHEIALRNAGTRQPGTAYALVTALLFAGGAALFLRSPASNDQRRP